jgi:tripartite-type tricarboxylate transporter receptor subunit TctC
VVSYLDASRGATYNKNSYQLLALHVVDPALFAVRPSSPYKDLKDLIEAAKTNPKKITISTTGVQSDETFAILQLQKMTGSQFALVHFSQGVAGAMTAFLGGKIDVLCANVGDLLAQFKSGEVRILGIMDDEPIPFYPGVKTFQQQGYKLSSSSSRGFAAPAGTPREVVNTLSGAIKKVVATEEHQKKMADMGLTIRYMDPVEYQKYWDEYEAMIKELLPLTKE